MRIVLLALFATAGCGVVLSAPLYESRLIFEAPATDPQFHAHGSCLVECPNGDLLAVWYENGTILPAPYYSERRDKSDDVHIGGSRKLREMAAWGERFVVADTFGVSDNNPCLAIDHDRRLWLIYPTIVGAPEWSWGSAIVRFAISTDYERPGPPVWARQNILLPHVEGIKDVVRKRFPTLEGSEAAPDEKVERFRQDLTKRLENPAYLRLGWMSRAHPLVRSDGALVLPLANENFNVASMAITRDGGETWQYSKPVPEAGLTQPTLLEFPDKTMVAFFRNGGSEHRIKRSESIDGGMTWGPVIVTDRLHPGSGIEALLLKDGNLLLIYNDVEQAPRSKLAVSLSTDRGKTWRWTRHLENQPGGRFDYPSIIQARDGTLHATFTVSTKTIKYTHFSEEWVKAGN